MLRCPSTYAMSIISAMAALRTPASFLRAAFPIAIRSSEPVYWAISVKRVRSIAWDFYARETYLHPLHHIRLPRVQIDFRRPSMHRFCSLSKIYSPQNPRQLHPPHEAFPASLVRHGPRTRQVWMSTDQPIHLWFN